MPSLWTVGEESQPNLGGDPSPAAQDDNHENDSVI